MSPSINPKSAAAISHRPSTPTTAVMECCRSPASVGGFPARNLPTISRGGTGDCVGRQRRKCEALRSNKLADRIIAVLCHVFPVESRLAPVATVLLFRRAFVFHNTRSSDSSLVSDSITSALSPRPAPPLLSGSDGTIPDVHNQALGYRSPRQFARYNF